VVHDGVSSTVYGGVSGLHATAPRIGATVAAITMQSFDVPSPGGSGRAMALAALNGLFGDRMATCYPELAFPMTVRRNGQDVSLDPSRIKAAFPRATERIAVFVHGLCETDASWRRKGRGMEEAASYASMLERDAGYTSVLIRYNTGLHVSDNGRQLAALIEQLTASWPVPVQGVALVGHSMGGLVARAASYYGSLDDHEWVKWLTHVFSLGAPHLGAPLEKGVHAASWLAARLPETRPVSELLECRSAGIKDLRFGACIEEDWRHADPGELLRDPCTEVPFVAHAGYYFTAVTVTEATKHPLGMLVGDLLVRLPSASGNGRYRRIPFDVDKGHHIGGLHHFDLLNHPAVYSRLLKWIRANPGSTPLNVCG
jgi:pimeloyl-ACP methyl ester carboxylesterase